MVLISILKNHDSQVECKQETKLIFSYHPHPFKFDFLVFFSRQNGSHNEGRKLKLFYNLTFR